MDSFGCAVADTIIIDVSSSVDLSLPNSLFLSDGSENGSFLSKLILLSEIEFLEIYDNWGNLILEGTTLLPVTLHWVGMENSEDRKSIRGLCLPFGLTPEEGKRIVKTKILQSSNNREFIVKTEYNLVDWR